MTTPIAPKNSTKSGSIKKRVAAVAGAATIGILTLAGPAAAQDTTEPTEERKARIERACERIPNLVTRSENFLDRINGDADTRGSLLWLDVKIVDVRERGREDVALVLENRREVRESLIPVLETRIERLDELSTRCDEAGFGQ